MIPRLPKETNSFDQVLHIAYPLSTAQYGPFQRIAAQYHLSSPARGQEHFLRKDATQQVTSWKRLSQEGQQAIAIFALSGTH